MNATTDDPGRERAATELGMCPAMLLPDLAAPSAEDLARAFRASAAVGCTDLSVWATHLPTKAELTSLGLHVSVLEAAVTWANGTGSESRAEAEGIAQLAVETGASLILAFARTAIDDWASARRNLQDLVAVAQQVGARVCVEFMPFGGIADLATAWRMIEPLGPHATLTIDTWHWCRQPGGPQLEVLSAIPGERVSFVQVSDAAPVAAEPLRVNRGSDDCCPATESSTSPPSSTSSGRPARRPFIAPEVFNPNLVASRGPQGAAAAAAGRHRGRRSAHSSPSLRSSWTWLRDEAETAHVLEALEDEALVSCGISGPIGSERTASWNRWLPTIGSSGVRMAQRLEDAERRVLALVLRQRRAAWPRSRWSQSV